MRENHSDLYNRLVERLRGLAAGEERENTLAELSGYVEERGGGPMAPLDDGRIEAVLFDLLAGHPRARALMGELGLNPRVPIIKRRAGKPLCVFVSHAKEDKPRVERYCEQLKEMQIKLWIDTNDLLVGQRWEEHISQTIKKCDLFLVYISRHLVSRTTGYVWKEIELALAREKEYGKRGHSFLIPVRLEDVEPPSNLKSFHWIDLFEIDRIPTLRLKIYEIARQRDLV